MLGLAFKPNTDDMREAKSVEVIERLLELGAIGARLRSGGDAGNARRMLPAAVVYCESPYEAAAGADAVALVTEWNEFKFLNLERLRAVDATPGGLRRPQHLGAGADAPPRLRVPLDRPQARPAVQP